jgi:hypothetical protein
MILIWRKAMKCLKHNQKIISTIIIFMMMIAFSLSYPKTVLAVVGISSISPNVVSNNTAVELVISGNEFQDGAKVILVNYGALVTNFVSSSVLSAILPNGINPGIYSISVINPDSSSVTLSNALTITGPENTPEPPASYNRPVIVIDGYSTGQPNVAVGEQATLSLQLRNKGQQMAYNVTLLFTPGDFIPLKTGGVVAVNKVEAGETKKASQPFTLSQDAMYKRYAPVVVTINYTDVNGTTFSETFNLSIPVRPPSSTGQATSTPTPTPTALPNQRPQLVITGYSTDLQQLRPGYQFQLTIFVENVGKSTAQRVSMIIGGGSSSGGNAGQGTPDSGGISGGSSNLTYFAPLASSNVQFLGDINTGVSQEIQALLIVNTTTQPGAYPLQISFTYISPNGGTFTDDQVITLLVYNPPQIEVNFYRAPGDIYVGQANILPIQVVNLGKSSVVLGNMVVSAPDSQLENNNSLVGPLDPGGYYTLDVVLIPGQPGSSDVSVQISYTDDFNQPNAIMDTIPIEILDMPVIEPPVEDGGNNGGNIPGEEIQPETFWQKLLRFFKGLFGLDSAAPTPISPVPADSTPSGETPEKPVPVPRGPKG